MMPEVLKLCFNPTGPDAEESTKVVIDIGWVAICRWKFEITTKTTSKKTHKHMSAVEGVRSERKMSSAERLAGKKRKATNDLAESAFSMVKEIKRRCGTNMGLHKCSGEAILRANKFVDRTGKQLGWLLNQEDWVQESIVVYAEEMSKKQDGIHQKALEQFGEHLLEKFRQQLEKQRRTEWDRYEKATRRLELIYTEECFRTEAEVDRGLEKLNPKQTRDVLKDQFRMWEEGAGWNRLFAMDGKKFSSDGSIQKFENGKLQQTGSRIAPDQVL